MKTTVNKTYVVTGTLINDHTVTLDEALPLTPMKVCLVVEPLSPASQRSYQDTIAKIRQRQLARDHKPPTREEVDAALRVERDSWEEE